MIYTIDTEVYINVATDIQHKIEQDGLIFETENSS